MSGALSWLPLLTALLGAVGAGLFQTFQKRWERKKESEATLAAIVMEVRAICRLMRLRGYLPHAQRVLEAVLADSESPATVVADIREDYFSVFGALSSKLGLLKPEDGALIVEFYSVCKSIIDSCRPDGIMTSNENWEMAVENMRQFVKLLDRALRVGDEVAQLLPMRTEVRQ